MSLIFPQTVLRDVRELLSPSLTQKVCEKVMMYSVIERVDRCDKIIVPLTFLTSTTVLDRGVRSATVLDRGVRSTTVLERGSGQLQC